MNHYPHHIGDFNNATRHLTRVERSLYRDLLDLYYDKEAPLPLDRDRLARLVLAATDEERAALSAVLAEFFTETPDGWRNARCDREIAVYQGKIAAASRAGLASAARRRSKNPEFPSAHDSATVVERSLNGRGTNQNQNQNHIYTHTQGEPPGEWPRRTAGPEWSPNEIVTRMERVPPGVNREFELERFRLHRFSRPKYQADFEAEWAKWLHSARPQPESTRAGGVDAQIEKVGREWVNG